MTNSFTQTPLDTGLPRTNQDGPGQSMDAQTTAYMKKFLVVNLTDKTIETMPLSEEMTTNYIGGKGFGARLLYDLLPPKTHPLSGENLLMFMTGPLTGTMAPAMRGCVVTKSPLTHTFLDSYFGGSFSPEIKYAGFDGIIVKGKASHPVYLMVCDDHVEIKDGRKLWGMDTIQANHAVKTELDDDTFKVVTIGPAGENQIPFSLICCEYNRQAGRGGSGAVMGAKNLKAIAVKGTKLVIPHNGPAFSKACQQAMADLDASEEVQELKACGTASAIHFSNENGLLPHKNYACGTYANAGKLANEGQKKHLWLGSAACMGCPIRCSKMGAVRTGKYKGIVSDMVEYETAALLGANLDISDIRAVAHLARLCDQLGIDTMSAGGVIGFAMEAVDKGILDAPENMALEFGNVQAAEALIQAIAGRKGRLGTLLAKGVKAAARELGPRAEAIAVHVKGLEAPAWGPRGASGTGLAIMTADRGACHQRGLPVAEEIGGVPFKGKTLEPTALQEKADLVFCLQNYLAGTDTLVKCDFGGLGIQPETYADLLSAATGKSFQKEDFDLVGERIWNLTRLFNLREGMDTKSEILPRRFVKEPLPDGPHKGHCISNADMDDMKQDYYGVRGWDEQGIPLASTLARLGIKGGDHE